jgi:hypothetical protein
MAVMEHRSRLSRCTVIGARLINLATFDILNSLGLQHLQTMGWSRKPSDVDQ